MKHFFIIFSSILLFNISCSNNDNNDNNDTSICDKAAQVISDNNFQDIITANYMITNVVLNGDCLSVTISSSGCDGATWQMKLLSSNSIFESFPIQREVKLELDNQEECLAVIQKTISFDLIPFQVDEYHQVVLNIDGWDQSIIYNY